MMFSMIVLAAATSAPSATDVYAVERDRILAPCVSETHDGRAFVEFAPTVETREVACSMTAMGIYRCLFEVRVKDYFANDFGPWETRNLLLTLADGCWSRVQDAPIT